MTLELDIEPIAAAKLAARAVQAGLPLNQFGSSIVLREANLDTEQVQSISVLTGAEKALLFQECLDRLPNGLPRLTLEDVSRERLSEKD